VQHETGRPLDLKLRGASYRVSVARIGHQRFRVGISAGGDVHPADADIERFDSYSGQITVNGHRYRLITSTNGPIHLVEVDGVTHRVSLDEGGVVRSPRRRWWSRRRSPRATRSRRTRRSWCWRA